MPSTNDLKKYFSFSKNIAIEVGDILLKEQEKVKVLKKKDKQDIATTADIKSEKYVVEKISNKFPSHSIQSEEVGLIKKSLDYLWIVDPLDGTKEYVRGITLWNFSIALEYKEKLITSVVYRPFEKSLYSALINKGSFLNGNQINVSDIKILDESFIYCYLPSYKRNKEKYQKSFELLSKLGEKAYRIRGMADENTACCWLAQGGSEAYVNLSNPPKWHDIAPGILIAKEAGAIICDIKGKDLVKDNFNGLIFSNNIKIRNQILKLLTNN